MVSNDLVFLDSLLGRKRSETAQSFSEDEFFELFCFEQILKQYDLGYEELLSGQVGGGGDGGVDGFFTFIDDELLVEDADLSATRKNPKIVVCLIQSKRSETFSECVFDRANATVSGLFDLGADLALLRDQYNAKLLAKAHEFKDAYLKLAALHPALRVNFVYASRGSTETLHPNVVSRSKVLKETLTGQFKHAVVTIEFVGASELLESSRVEKTYTLQLRFGEYASNGPRDYVLLAGLSDYFDFVTDEANHLRSYIFEDNVRDYLGNVEVNRDIGHTLASNDGVDFWYLNNGVTILASRASIAGKTISLDDVQIVNGLQTTKTIFAHFNRTPEGPDDDARSILAAC